MSFLPENVELHRDRMWRREESLKIETVVEAEKLIETNGFCAAMTDARKEIPSVYVAVCGRREVYTPRNVQKDVETSQAWVLKDEVLRRGRVFYGKATKQQAVFIAPRLIAAFNSLFGVAQTKEKELLSANALAVLAVLRSEFEQASADLRQEAKIPDRKEFNKALDELQNRMKVVPSEVMYEPKFTYIWTLAEIRFPVELAQKLDRERAITEIAQAYLHGAGQTTSKNLAKIIGITPLEANLGFLNLVEEDFAEQTSPGEFRLADLVV